MGHRLSRIYTRTGDDGTTGLADGSRIAKNSLRIEAMGEMDELNAQCGILIECLEKNDVLRTELQRVQHHLFDLGGELSIPGSQMVGQRQIDWLEKTLDGWNEELPPLQNFILPGGSMAAAQCHMARVICRRAERVCVALGHEEAINPVTRQYLNRLSDFLFVAARVLARREGAQEVLWDQTLSGAEP